MRNQKRAADNDTRTRIVRAAFKNAAKRGLSGVTIREVAAEAGLSHPTLHYYFASKPDLLAAVAKYAVERCVALDQSPEFSTSQKDSLQNAVRTIVGTFRRDPEAVSVLNEFLQYGENLEVSWNGVAIKWRQWLSETGSLIEDMRLMGTIRTDVDPYSVAVLLVVVATGLPLLDNVGIEVQPESLALLLTQLLTPVATPACSSSGEFVRPT
jgi:AcrR family transcriptional regulator